MHPDDLANRFDYHAPDDEKRTLHGAVRAECKALAELLNTWLPEGREAALAMTKLEECMFWANAAIARA